MRKFIYNICFLIVSLTASSQIKLTAQEISTFKNKVENDTKSIKTIATDFVQSKHLDFMSNDIVTSGKMYFKSPNWLNWQYTDPYNYSIIFKNDKIFINDQGKKSNVDANNKMFKKINSLIVGSVSGNMFDDKEFTIQYFKNNTHIIVKLEPKTAMVKKYITEIELHFLKSESTVNKVKLIEPSKDFTLIEFKNKKINVNLNDSNFTN